MTTNNLFSIVRVFSLILVMSVCLSCESETKAATQETIEKNEITNATEIIIVKLETEKENILNKENDTLKTDSSSTSDTAQVLDYKDQQDSPPHVYTNEDIMKEYFGEASGYTTGEGASGPLYVCGYVGGEDGDVPRTEAPDVDLDYKRPVSNNKNVNNNNKYLDKPFVPSPEITQNVIEYQDDHHSFYEGSYEEEAEPEYYNFDYDHTDEQKGCDGWKVVYHPMSRIFPFKYKTPMSY